MEVKTLSFVPLVRLWEKYRRGCSPEVTALRWPPNIAQYCATSAMLKQYKNGISGLSVAQWGRLNLIRLSVMMIEDAACSEVSSQSQEQLTVVLGDKISAGWITVGMVVLMKTRGGNDCRSNGIIRDLVIHANPGSSLNSAAAHSYLPNSKAFLATLNDYF